MRNETNLTEEGTSKELETIVQALQESENALKLRVRQRGIVADLGQRALAGADLDALMAEAAQLVAQTLEVEYCDIMELLPGDTLLLRTGHGWKMDYVGIARVSSGIQSISGYTVLTNEAVVIEDLATETRFEKPTYLVDHGVVSGISIVIHGHEKPFGAVAAYSTKRRAFNRDEINFLQTVANVLAMAIQRKQSEEAFYLLARIVQSSDDAIISMTTEGTIVSWNPGAEWIYGYKSEEVTGASVSILFPQGQSEELLRILEKINQGQGIDHYETIHMKKGGTTIDVSLTVSPIEDKTGKIVGMSTISRDITEQKRAQEKLRRSEMQLAVAQEMAHVGSWERDLATDTAIWSTELNRIFGVNSQKSSDTFQGFLLHVHPDDRAMVEKSVTSALKGQKSFSFEFRLIRPGGEIRTVSAQGKVIANEAGEPIKILGAAQDITDRKRFEEQLRTSREQLRALSAHLQSVREEERVNIAREVHDELGQVLTALKMDLSLLNYKLMESSAVIPRRMLFDEIKSMSNLVDTTIQSVRKIVTELRPEVLDHLGLKASIEWQAQEFQTRTGIICNMDSNLESIEVEDRDCATAVFRILQETLTNVARHSNATRVEITLKEEEELLILQVKDNGRGITENEISNAKSFGLLGIKERVLLLGGQVEIQGGSEKGTSVTVEVPLSAFRKVKS